jgi:hypothetical protein
MTTNVPVDEFTLNDAELNKLRVKQEAELKSFELNNVYERVPIHTLPYHVRPIPSKFINSKKLNSETLQYDYKARLVAIGIKHFDQRGDLIDVTTAMPPLESFRIFLAFVAARKGFRKEDIQQADVITAFLQSDISSVQTVYISPQRGHPDYGVYVWRLNKSMYGIRDAPRHWELHFRKILESLGWKRTIYDGVYIRFKSGVFDGLLFTWVDDLLALSGATSATQILREISLHIRINIKGVPNHFIGQDLVITDDSITLSQHNYAQSIEVEHADSVIQNPLPLDVLRDEDTSAYLSKEDITMRNIAYAYSYFGTYASKPTHKAYRLLYRACQYVKQNSDKCLIYKVQQTNGFHVQAWCDASLGSYTHDSQTGYIITLKGSPILWRSVVQKRARHSSTEAECSAMHDCLDKLILCMYFISELHVKVHSTVYSDSLDLIKLLQADHPRPTA